MEGHVVRLRDVAKTYRAGTVQVPPSGVSLEIAPRSGSPWWSAHPAAARPRC